MYFINVKNQFIRKCVYALKTLKGIPIRVLCDLEKENLRKNHCTDPWFVPKVNFYWLWSLQREQIEFFK